MRYKEKVEQKLVPHQYDKSSRRFNEGAHRHWEGMSPSVRKGTVDSDRRMLEYARDKR